MSYVVRMSTSVLVQRLPNLPGQERGIKSTSDFPVKLRQVLDVSFTQYRKKSTTPMPQLIRLIPTEMYEKGDVCVAELLHQFDL